MLEKGEETLLFLLLLLLFLFNFFFIFVSLASRGLQTEHVMTWNNACIVICHRHYKLSSDRVCVRYNLTILWASDKA